MGSLPKNNYSPLDNHNSILQEVLENSLPSDSLIRSYRKSFNGFVANLTEKERQKLASKAGIVSIFPNKKYQLLTTRSWDFMGFTENVKRAPQAESDVIVGVIDSGIIESESFSDEGFGAPPKKWNGVCEGGKGFKCNNKLIGARFYGRSEDARDNVGHGTHTASTAAGNQVNNVSFYGFAPGNARGAVPSARIAVYKVCGGSSDCSGASILAAFDDAISDNVDILSISLGGEGASMYLADPIAIGSFHAMQKGILTSQAAGNSGPSRFTVTSIAPWLLAVAASTTDRKIITKINLGDNTTLVGRAINSFNRTKTASLVDRESPFRKSLSFVYNSYEDNIVVFDELRQDDLISAVESNAAGFISLTDCGMNYSRIVPLPGLLLNSSDAEILRSYKEEASNPVATIFRSETLKDAAAPPDIAAPGVEIIAAWAPNVPLSGGDKRSVKYSILSGTSMACPHVTGAAAYVKSFHPDWSPSAIQSALMTTAFPLNATQNSDAELAYGAGHIDPVKAVNPGLVYEATDVDYIAMLCNSYTSYEIRQLDDNFTCPEELILVKDLNYPSLATFSMANFSGEVTFKRTVTNVGVAKSSYKVTIHPGSNLKISVEPEVLSFESLNEKKSFTVTVSTKGEGDGFISSGSIVWSDGVHNVRSPIVIS
ncbi:Subtilisin-like protease SBT4.8 [Thalictrum thalictroides]|uniref:Subtilisin-like protease SBT4.8 n=1 Tax=Thalictrum thalictroides TaxID=46969 RepID=A0A7J6VJQ8_THATH|nr:Subtilisin-like protease SBT4.8 [Thalictrum thalictroides]